MVRPVQCLGIGSSHEQPPLRCTRLTRPFEVGHLNQVLTSTDMMV
jgi:hypothetical protein